MPDYLAEGARWMRQAQQDLDDAEFAREGEDSTCPASWASRQQKKRSKPTFITATWKTSGGTR